MISGACHCGKVKWTYSAKLESATACNCTLCSRYGALWAYAHIGQGIEISGPTKSYARGSQRNGFHFCENCGCLAYYMAKAKDEQGRVRAAVNLRMSNEPEKIQSLPLDHFDGLEKFEDLPRDTRVVKDLWF